MPRKPVDVEAFLSQPTRYGIVSRLAVGPVKFAELRRRLNLTDGNLAVHIKALVARGYVEVAKEFVDWRPQTTYSLTADGRAAMETYLGSSGVVH